MKLTMDDLQELVTVIDNFNSLTNDAVIVRSAMMVLSSGTDVSVTYSDLSSEFEVEVSA